VCPLRWGSTLRRFLNETRGIARILTLIFAGRGGTNCSITLRTVGRGARGDDRQLITMHARLAVREVAKVFGVPPDERESLHEAAAAPAGA